MKKCFSTLLQALLGDSYQKKRCGKDIRCFPICWSHLGLCDSKQGAEPALKPEEKDEKQRGVNTRQKCLEAVYTYLILSSWSANSSSLKPNWSTKFAVICWIWYSEKAWEQNPQRATGQLQHLRYNQKALVYLTAAQALCPPSLSQAAQTLIWSRSCLLIHTSFSLHENNSFFLSVESPTSVFLSLFLLLKDNPACCSSSWGPPTTPQVWGRYLQGQCRSGQR